MADLDHWRHRELQVAGLRREARRALLHGAAKLLLSPGLLLQQGAMGWGWGWAGLEWNGSTRSLEKATAGCTHPRRACVDLPYAKSAAWQAADLAHWQRCRLGAVGLGRQVRQALLLGPAGLLLSPGLLLQKGVGGGGGYVEGIRGGWVGGWVGVWGGEAGVKPFAGKGTILKARMCPGHWLDRVCQDCRAGSPP